MTTLTVLLLIIWMPILAVIALKASRDGTDDDPIRVALDSWEQHQGH